MNNCKLLWCLLIATTACSRKTVVGRDHIYLIDATFKGHAVLVYGASAHISEMKSIAPFRYVFQVPQNGVVCVREQHPDGRVGTDEFRFGSLDASRIPVASPGSGVLGRQIWWRSMGSYFPNRLGDRNFQSTSEPGVMHFERFFVSPSSERDVNAESDKNAFLEQAAKYCGLG